jgi:hypothetical protein
MSTVNRGRDAWLLAGGSLMLLAGLLDRGTFLAAVGAAIVIGSLWRLYRSRGKADGAA